VLSLNLFSVYSL